MQADRIQQVGCLIMRSPKVVKCVCWCAACLTCTCAAFTRHVLGQPCGQEGRVGQQRKDRPAVVGQSVVAARAPCIPLATHPYGGLLAALQQQGRQPRRLRPAAGHILLPSLRMNRELSLFLYGVIRPASGFLSCAWVLTASFWFSKHHIAGFKQHAVFVQ